MKTSATHRDFAEALRSAPDLESCQGCLAKALREYGIETFMYGFIPHAHPTRNSAAHAIALSFHPQDFMSHYHERGLQQHDPSIFYCLNETQPFRWMDPRINARLTARQLQVGLDAHDFGLQNGLTIPLRGVTPFDRGGIGLNAGRIPAKEFSAIYSAHLNDIVALVELFNEAVLSRLLLSKMVTLSSREAVCLQRAAEGFNAEETADVLHIGVDAVKQYLSRARRKLNACNVTQAAARAVTLGIFNSRYP